VWKKGRPIIIPTVNPFEILNSISTQSGGWSAHAISTRIRSICSATFLLFFHLPFYCQCIHSCMCNLIILVYHNLYLLLHIFAHIFHHMQK
jgi:hypothetical protein